MINKRSFDDLTIVYILKHAVNELKQAIANLKAVVDNKVSKAGDTMTGALRVQMSTIDQSTPSSNKYANAFAVDDANGKNIGGVQAHSMTDGNRGITILAQRQINNTWYYNVLRFGVNESGESLVILSANAWRKALGLGSSGGALPITVGQGGTGQTGTISENTVSNVITAASGFTITAVGYKQWGKLAMVAIAAKKTTAQTSVANMTVGTIVSGKRSSQTVGGTFVSISTLNWACTNATGTVVVNGTLAANTEFWVNFMYLLP